jgi:hypothetical protein
MSRKIDKTIERKMFFHGEADPPDNCPQCGQPLVQDFGPYQVVTRSERKLTDQFMMSGEFGYLCPGCATAVIHAPELAERLYGGPMKPGWQAGPQFTVLGLVDLDAIPPEQAHVPINNLDPYPLVPFHAAAVPKQKRPSHSKRPRKPKPPRKK